MTKDRIYNFIAGIFTIWAVWISSVTVENKTLAELNEYRIDSISPVLQANSEK